MLTAFQSWNIVNETHTIHIRTMNLGSHCLAAPTIVLPRRWRPQPYFAGSAQLRVNSPFSNMGYSPKSELLRKKRLIDRRLRERECTKPRVDHSGLLLCAILGSNQ